MEKPKKDIQEKYKQMHKDFDVNSTRISRRNDQINKRKEQRDGTFMERRLLTSNKKETVVQNKPVSKAKKNSVVDRPPFRYRKVEHPVGFAMPSTSKQQQKLTPAKVTMKNISTETQSTTGKLHLTKKHLIPDVKSKIHQTNSQSNPNVVKKISKATQKRLAAKAAMAAAMESQKSVKTQQPKENEKDNKKLKQGGPSATFKTNHPLFKNKITKIENEKQKVAEIISSNFEEKDELKEMLDKKLQEETKLNETFEKDPNLNGTFDKESDEKVKLNETFDKESEKKFNLNETFKKEDDEKSDSIKTFKKEDDEKSDSIKTFKKEDDETNEKQNESSDKDVDNTVNFIMSTKFVTVRNSKSLVTASASFRTSKNHFNDQNLKQEIENLNDESKTENNLNVSAKHIKSRPASISQVNKAQRTLRSRSINNDNDNSDQQSDNKNFTTPDTSFVKTDEESPFKMDQELDIKIENEIPFPQTNLNNNKRSIVMEETPKSKGSFIESSGLSEKVDLFTPEETPKSTRISREASIMIVKDSSTSRKSSTSSSRKDSNEKTQKSSESKLSVIANSSTSVLNDDSSIDVIERNQSFHSNITANGEKFSSAKKRKSVSYKQSRSLSTNKFEVEEIEAVIKKVESTKEKEENMPAKRNLDDDSSETMKTSSSKFEEIPNSLHKHKLSVVTRVTRKRSKNDNLNSSSNVAESSTVGLKKISLPSQEQKDQERGNSEEKKELNKDEISPKKSVVQDLNTSMEEEEEKTAKYFKLLANTEIVKLKGLCDTWSEKMESEGISEDGKYMINQAIGQAQLLLQKKMQKFLSLVKNCENSKQDNLVTCRDLQGFWDMTFIEIRNCQMRFRKLSQYQANNWIETEEVKQLIPKLKKNANKKTIQSQNKEVTKPRTGIRDMIRAAKMKKKSQENDIGVVIVDNVQKKNELPLFSPQLFQGKSSTPKVSATKMFEIKRQSLKKESPFTLMKVSNLLKTPQIELDDCTSYVNSNQNPGKSILKKIDVNLDSKSSRKSINRVNFGDKTERSDVNVIEKQDHKQTLPQDNLSGELEDSCNEVSVIVGKKLIFNTSDKNQDSVLEDSKKEKEVGNKKSISLKPSITSTNSENDKAVKEEKGYVTRTLRSRSIKTPVKPSPKEAKSKQEGKSSSKVTESTKKRNQKTQLTKEPETPMSGNVTNSPRSTRGRKRKLATSSGDAKENCDKKSLSSQKSTQKVVRVNDELIKYHPSQKKIVIPRTPQPT